MYIFTLGKVCTFQTTSIFMVSSLFIVQIEPVSQPESDMFTCLVLSIQSPNTASRGPTQDRRGPS